MSADLLAMTVGQLLERLLSAAPAAEADRWVDIREQGLAPHRVLLDAAKAGELALYKVGRRTLVRQSELDRWVQLPQHRVTEQLVDTEPEVASGVAHILAAHGFRKAAGG